MKRGFWSETFLSKEAMRDYMFALLGVIAAWLAIGVYVLMTMAE